VDLSFSHSVTKRRDVETPVRVLSAIVALAAGAVSGELTLALFALLVKAGKKALTLVTLITEEQDQHVTLAILNLIDVTLIAALVVIVTISVYENFVARISPQDHGDWPNGSDISTSRNSNEADGDIVAITAIELLEAFIDANETTDRDLFFAIGIHLTSCFRRSPSPWRSGCRTISRIAERRPKLSFLSRRVFLTRTGLRYARNAPTARGPASCVAACSSAGR